MDAALVILAAAIVAAAFILARRGGGRDPSASAGRLAAEAESARFMHARLDQTAAALSELAGRFEERRRLEEQAVVAVERIERLVAGSFAKGRAGENLLEAALAQFPPDLVLRDFEIGGRVCEFALRLDDGKLLAVDSKWPAADLEALDGAAGPAAREELRKRIDRAVCGRLREATVYIDPAVTAPMAVIALPDGVYACCRRAHALARESRLLLVSYSLAVPFLLGLSILYRTYARGVDEERLLSRLREVAVCLRDLGERIEGKLSKGLTMASNAIAEMRGLVARGQDCLAAIERSPPDPMVALGAAGDEEVVR